MTCRVCLGALPSRLHPITCGPFENVRAEFGRDTVVCPLMALLQVVAVNKQLI